MRGALRTVWDGWKRLARRIGDFQARVILFVLYFVIVAPFALVIRWISDPLAVKPGSPTGWRPRREAESDRASQARRQF